MGRTKQPEEMPLTRKVLSENLRTLMKSGRYPGRESILKVALYSRHHGGALSNGTVGRIASGSHATDVDALLDLANVFELQPWQLLVENLQPAALPALINAALIEDLRKVVALPTAPVSPPTEGQAPEADAAESMHKPRVRRASPQQSRTKRH